MVVETLREPDKVRRTRDKCFFYYKGFDTYLVRPGITAPAVCRHFVVVVSLVKKLVLTFYPTDQVKGEPL